mmetsp:Transcript_27018/g.54893  ORF Transcript_27018/g.54893 Transcript_27018/m.54893 type:complete len:428 (-) Transcript_27018:267-1550(-)
MSMCDRGTHFHTPDMGDPEGETLQEESEVFEVDEQISEKINELKTGTIREAILAAEFLFARAHTSHHKAEENKQQIRREGAIPHLCRLLTESSIEARYQACSALSELAFRNERNCIGIVCVPGALDALIHLLNNSNMQEDAALVLNNCAAFCEDACQIMVRYKGLVPALKKLAIGPVMGAKNVAVGAINCLSRCPAAKDILMSYRIVEEALTPVLRETGSGDKHEARLARAAMAVANLTCRTRSCFTNDADHFQAVATAVKILGYALDGKSWAGIFFAPYSVLYPLRNLSSQEENCNYLVECGLVELLARFLAEWKRVGHHAERTLVLALETAVALSGRFEWQQRLRASGVLQSLKMVCGRGRGESEECAELASGLLDTLLESHTAVFMGQHARVGAGSRLHSLDEYVTGIILDYSLGGRLCTFGAH